MSFRLWFYTALVVTPFFLAALTSAQSGKSVMVITVDGIINPVSSEYITKSITAANADISIEALVIEMDTPGGLDTSMRVIIKKMQASATPIVVYVAPSGSRAASAGAFITMAAHVAAMAPGTNIGSASPVNMGGGGMDRTMKKKVTNDAAAYIRSLAKAHGRNEDMGEKFVRKAVSIAETEALKNNVIDLIARNLDDLLKSIDGMTVKTVSGERTLATAGAAVNRVEMTWRQKFFNALANPNIAYMLMMLGFYGLFFELSNPGTIFPGVIGAISLIIGFYSMQALPINYAGALLILMAFIMFLLEVWVTSFGMLTIGGIAALIIGSLMLVDSPEEYLRISLAVIIPTALFTTAFFTFIITAAIRAMKRIPVSGKSAMVGAVGKAESKIAQGKPGKVFVEGELWNAVTKNGDIKEGAEVEVVGISGLTLSVRAK